MCIRDSNTTGDGIVTAIQILTVMAETKQSLSQLAKVMHVLPQAQVGAKVPDSRKEEYKEDAEVQSAIAKLEQKYAGKGRVLIRPSGTEPLVRVMIEGPDQAQIDQDVYELAMMIQKKFGKSE